MAPSSAEIICALGAADRLVGVSSFCTYPPQIASVARIGGLRDPDLETILTLKPDLLVMRGASESLRKLCRGHDITIYEDPTETLDDIYRTIDDLGAMLDHHERATELVVEVKDRLTQVRRRVAGLARPRVLFAFRNRDRLATVYTVGQGSYLDEIITIAGGDNVFGDLEVAYPEVGQEEIRVRAPEIIVVAEPGDDLDVARHADIVAAWTIMDTVPAVANRRVYVITERYVTIPSPRVTLLASRLADLFHPQATGGATTGG